MPVMSLMLAFFLFAVSHSDATSEHNKFDNQNDFEGWNCGSITTCGEFGQFCGGFNVKGTGADIKKTFNDLPAGTYSVELDFIKIDSWSMQLI